MKSAMIHEPLTKLQCCPTSDGGAAAGLVSQSFPDAWPWLKSQAVLMAGQCLVTDSPSLFSRSQSPLYVQQLSFYRVRDSKISIK
jgi:sterol carrier protein 2